MTQWPCLDAALLSACPPQSPVLESTETQARHPMPYQFSGVHVQDVCAPVRGKGRQITRSGTA
jgi:hypothetical protein